MAKGIKKPNPKAGEGKPAAAEAEKKLKIAKKVKAGEKAAKKSNPSGAAAKGQKIKRTPTARNYFTVADDFQILEASKNKDVKPISNIAKEVADHLHRSPEAVRDRLKRYIVNLSAADQKELAVQAKKNPRWYVHFKADKNDKTKKSIEKIVDVAPALQNREFQRKPRTSKKPPTKVNKKAINYEDRFRWVIEKLQNKDAYFKLEFSVQLLADILNIAIREEGVSHAEVDRLLNSIHCDQNLGQILDSLKLKK